MGRIDISFLVLATLMLIVGVSLGIFMAGSQDFQLRPVHAHINLVGWASLALFGLVYRAYPQLAERRLAKLHFMLSAPAAVLLPVGIILAVTVHNEVVAIVSSLMWLAGSILFLIQLLSLAGTSDRAPAPLPAE